MEELSELGQQNVELIQMGVVVRAEITSSSLQDFLVEARDITSTDAMGAVVTFEGCVRNHDGGSKVISLTYSAHPDAETVLRKVLESVIADHSATRISAGHRVGALSVGDLAFVVVVAAAHRGAAFAAVEDAVNRVKAEVPIWKEQRLADGSVEWVGLS